ncbi:PIN-like domain-containing protein [Sulfitobacter sp.]|uniref:PIN-like domain-containing protein n=1 Tax=Sulfitobacter sp. TaxID=1903071 RepID=UPI003EF2E016
MKRQTETSIDNREVHGKDDDPIALRQAASGGPFDVPPPVVVILLEVDKSAIRKKLPRFSQFGRSTMRSQFSFHFKKSDADVKKIWDEPIFAFDANILLHLYRYSPDTRSELIELIDKISQHLWLPEQAAYEYLKNRPTVISEQIGNLEIARKEVCDSKSKLTDQLKNKNTRSYPYYSEAAKDKYEDGTRALLDELDKSLLEISGLYNDDPTKEKIADWFEGRTGQSFTATEFDQHCEDGEVRYLEKTPPGYADAEDKRKKDTLAEKRSRYGDWLIWRQLMDHAKAEKRDVIFVTDDAKEDWWQKKGEKGDGEIITPRPELIEEFYRETGQHVLVYSFLKFLKHGRTHLNFEVSTEAEDETKTFNLEQVAKSAAFRRKTTSAAFRRAREVQALRRAGNASTSRSDDEGLWLGSEDDRMYKFKDRMEGYSRSEGADIEGLESRLKEIRNETHIRNDALRDAEMSLRVLTGDNPAKYRALSSEEWVAELNRAKLESKEAQKRILELNRIEVELMHRLGAARGHE